MNKFDQGSSVNDAMALEGRSLKEYVTIIPDTTTVVNFTNIFEQLFGMKVICVSFCV